VCITGRRGVKGSFKVYACNVTLWVGFWNNKTEEKINVRIHKE